MLLIPAIDIKNGQCVRLKQGRKDRVDVFDSDPVNVAGRWAKSGARRLHLVDLDGAFDGEPVNAELIEKIAHRHPQLEIQIGGGIRDMATANRYMAAGVRYLIIGTRAIEDPAFLETLCRRYPQRIMAGIDARDGRVAIAGWEKTTDVDALILAENCAKAGAAGIIYTDISRDGMMQGVNLESTRQLAESVTIPVIASGGVSSYQDIDNLYRTGSIAGAIIGRAIYQGNIELQSALADLAETTRSDFWRNFLQTLPEHHSYHHQDVPEAEYFGDTTVLADELADLIRTGRKTATCGRYLGENLHMENPLTIVLDGSDNPACLIKTVEITVRPYNEIDARFAADEGEGDGSLAYWRQAHREFFNRESIQEHYTVSDDMLLKCERFELLYSQKRKTR